MTTTSEATPETLASLIHPEDRESVLAHLQKCSEQGDNYEIEHACHAIKDGGRVEIATFCSEKDRTVSVQVSDTGCGIAPDLMDRIWDPFFTTKEVGMGIGLGLALSCDIVKRHGGEITVKSIVDAGSQFMASLPMCSG